jgi:uncharacterized protein (DUF305 family)
MHVRSPVLALAVLLIVGCRPPAVAAQDPATRPAPDAVARARADSIRYPWTPADARFMTRMIHHHAQAVTMARMAPAHGASDEVQRLAARIINAQQDEITLMQRWLTNRRQPAPDPFDAHAAHVHHDSTMIGMLTPQELAELDRTTGKAFDRLFLISMIRHHRGAVAMVEELFSTPGAGQDEATFKFASDVHVDQVTEIARMQKLLLGVTLGVTPQ